MNAPSTSTAAFTMLEMLLALAIFAILLGLVITAMPRWQHAARVKHATQLTRAGLEFARDRANAIRQPTTFFGTNSLQTPFTGTFFVQSMASPTNLLCISLPRGVTFLTTDSNGCFLADTPQVTFFPDSCLSGNVNISLLVGITNLPAHTTNSPPRILTATITVSKATATVLVTP